MPCCNRDAMSLQHRQLSDAQPRSTGDTLNKRFSYRWRRNYTGTSKQTTKKNFDEELFISTC